MKLNKKIKILIAADGGAGSGKTSATKMFAKKYGFKLLSSGTLYRFVAIKLLNNKKNISDYSFLKKITKKIKSKDLKNKNLYSNKVTEFSSIISKQKNIRKLLKQYQKKFSKNRLAIIEGRDIGSVIAPNADIKIFFKASLNCRARRRFKEYRKNKNSISFNEVKKTMKIRDLNDTKRKISPLRPSKGCVIVDTTKINKKQVLLKLSKILELKIKLKYGKNIQRPFI